MSCSVLLHWCVELKEDQGHTSWLLHAPEYNIPQLVSESFNVSCYRVSMQLTVNRRTASNLNI